jgi:hypothetical protein
MASVQILISSERERARNPTQVINPSDFTYNFSAPLNLGDQFWEVCLLKLNVWNSVRNMVGQTILFTVASTDVNLTIPDGQYSVEDLNLFIQAHIAATIPAGVGQLLIRPNLNTNKVEVVLVGATTELVMNGYQAGFFGFSEFGSGTPVTLTGTGTYTGNFIAQVSNGADAYQLRTDLHKNAFAEGRVSDVLFQFTPAVPPQAAIDVDPVHLIYHQVNKSTINSIQIRWTDQTGRLLDFGGEDTSCILHLRQITK